MFDLSKNYGTDQKKEVEGIWETLDEDSGARVLVARFNNKRFRKKWNSIPQYTQRQIANGGIGDEQLDAIVSRIMADTILLDWENLSDNGVELEYSVENAFEMLKKHNEFRELIFNISQNVSKFRVDDALGN